MQLNVNCIYYVLKLLTYNNIYITHQPVELETLLMRSVGDDFLYVGLYHTCGYITHQPVELETLLRGGS